MDDSDTSIPPRLPGSSSGETTKVIVVIPPARYSDEPPLQGYQMEIIRGYCPEIDPDVISELGEHQAEYVIDQLRAKQMPLREAPPTEAPVKAPSAEAGDSPPGDQPEEVPYESKIVTVEEKGAALDVWESWAISSSSGFFCISLPCF